MKISFWITPALFTLLAFNAAYGRQQSGTNVSTEPEAQRGDTTILQAVAMAGDFKPQSRSSQVLLFRRVSDDWVEVKELDLKRMLRSRNLNEDPHLRPGDMVFVPKSRWSKFDRFIPVPTLG